MPEISKEKLRKLRRPALFSTEATIAAMEAFKRIMIEKRVNIYNICGHRIKIYLKKDPTIKDDMVKNYFIIQNEFYKAIGLDKAKFYINVYIEQNSKWIKLWNNRKFNSRNDICIYPYHLKELFYEIKDFDKTSSKSNEILKDPGITGEKKINQSESTSLLIDNFDIGFAK